MVTLTVLAALLVTSAMIAGFETAVFSLRRAERRRLTEAGGATAAVLARRDELLQALLLGNLFVNVGYYSAVSASVLDLFAAGRVALGVLLSATTVVLLILLGEIVPKNVALRRRVWMVERLAAPFVALRVVLRPFTAVATLTSRALEALILGGREPPPAPGLDEFKRVVAMQASLGAYGAVQSELIKDVVDFGRRRADDLMVPRVDVVFLDLHEPPGAWIETMRGAPHGDYPVCDGEPDAMVGMMRAARFLRDPTGDRRALTEPAIFVPSTVKAEALLDRLHRERARVAVVLDEFGGLEGLVGLADLARVALGEVAEPQGASIAPRPGGGFSVAGGTRLADLEERVGLVLPVRRADTLGGALAEMLGSVPRRGDEVLATGWRLRVLSVRNRRVERVALRPVVGEVAS